MVVALLRLPEGRAPTPRKLRRTGDGGLRRHAQHAGLHRLPKRLANDDGNLRRQAWHAIATTSVGSRPRRSSLRDLRQQGQPVRSGLRQLPGMLDRRTASPATTCSSTPTFEGSRPRRADARGGKLGMRKCDAGSCMREHVCPVTRGSNVTTICGLGVHFDPQDQRPPGGGKRTQLPE